MTGRRYLDPGGRISGRQDLPRRCQVLTRWGPGGGPRNVLVQYDDGTQAVIPFARRLLRCPANATPEEITVEHDALHAAQEGASR